MKSYAINFLSEMCRAVSAGKQVGHLSHNDLDGYGCQIVTSAALPYIDNIWYNNTDYGDEIEVRLDELLSKDIKYLLITDVNISAEIAKYINTTVRLMGVKVLVVDHHQNKDIADKYQWYYLDTSKSGTLSLYELYCQSGNPPMSDNIKANTSRDNLKLFVETVNAYDLYLQDSELFTMGRVMALAIKNQENWFGFRKPYKYDSFIDGRFHLSLYFVGHVGMKTPVELEESLYDIKKSLTYAGLKSRPPYDTSLYSDIVTKKTAELWSEDHFFIFVSDDKRPLKGLITYEVADISALSHRLFELNDDIDFVIKVSSKGTCELRGHDKCDCSQIAKKLFGGGGHKNAAGGLWINFTPPTSNKDLYHRLYKLIDEIN